MSLSVSPESVFFFTFHKCASSFFGTYALKQLQGLEHVDYASRLYSSTHAERLTFERHGFVYGPIRLSVQEASPVYQHLVRPVSQADFIHDKKAIFFVRDPRDILVSAYYSFGYSHGLSDVAEIRAQQIARREAIRQQTLDDYALEAASDQVRYFDRLHTLSMACRQSLLLRYEDMIDDFERFIAEFRRIVEINDEAVNRIHAMSRPRSEENPAAHRRSGKVGGFRDKLRPETIDILNIRLARHLSQFGYSDS